MEKEIMRGREKGRERQLREAETEKERMRWREKGSEREK
jgi:hypothetical protein